MWWIGQSCSESRVSTERRRGGHTASTVEPSPLSPRAFCNSDELPIAYIECRTPPLRAFKQGDVSLHEGSVSRPALPPPRDDDGSNDRGEISASSADTMLAEDVSVDIAYPSSESICILQTVGCGQSGMRQGGIRQDGIRQDGIRQDGMRQDGIRQDGIRQGGIEQE